jgi:isochorismate synthase
MTELWSSTEYEEQEYVTRFITEVLDQCSLYNREVEGPVTMNAGNCLHLRTDFTVQTVLSPAETDRLIRLLHPTPAVCGYPQQESMNEILNREKHDRQFYSGYLGPVSAVDKMDLFVNLRCMKVGTQQAELFVGGGITKDSDPQAEWEETILKLQTLLSKIEGFNMD